MLAGKSRLSCFETQSLELLLLAFLTCYASLMPLFSQYFGDWKPISRWAGISWLLAFALFYIYAATRPPAPENFLIIDFVNLIIHEGGHFFFSWFGRTVMILGGTLGELIVPFLCASYFFYKREVAAVAFCFFWFFENFLYIGTYMADARNQALELVGSGEHDWLTLFTQWDLVVQDQKIGNATRLLGWLGMLASISWLAYRSWRSNTADEP